MRQALEELDATASKYGIRPRPTPGALQPAEVGGTDDHGSAVGVPGYTAVPGAGAVPTVPTFDVATPQSSVGVGSEQDGWNLSPGRAGSSHP